MISAFYIADYKSNLNFLCVCFQCVRLCVCLVSVDYYSQVRLSSSTETTDCVTVATVARFWIRRVDFICCETRQSTAPSSASR